MKKLICLLSLNFILALAFGINVKAATYQADELTRGQFLEVGDIIEFGSGTWEGQELWEGRALDYDKVSLNGYSGRLPISIVSDDSYTVPTTYFIDGIGWSDGTIKELTIYFHTMEGYFSLNDNTPITSISIHEGETLRVYVHYEGGVPPFSFGWGALRDRTLINGSFLGYTDYNYFDINYGEWEEIQCILCDNEGHGGYIRLPIYNIEGEENSNNDTDSEVQDSKINDAPQTPSTVPNGTVQISLGTNDKTFSNIKALTPFLHDSVNQKIIADLYAKGQKKRASIITQKNLIPPYGVKNEWKTQSHTVRWKDLAVKKGDSIVIIWYTPMFGLHAPTLKYIPAIVVEDGTIEFTIPAIGDMSVMSIVKLI